MQEKPKYGDPVDLPECATCMACCACLMAISGVLLAGLVHLIPAASDE